MSFKNMSCPQDASGRSLGAGLDMCLPDVFSHNANKLSPSPARPMLHYPQTPLNNRIRRAERFSSALAEVAEKKILSAIAGNGKYAHACATGGPKKFSSAHHHRHRRPAISRQFCPESRAIAAIPPSSTTLIQPPPKRDKSGNTFAFPWLPASAHKPSRCLDGGRVGCRDGEIEPGLRYNCLEAKARQFGNGTRRLCPP